MLLALLLQLLFAAPEAFHCNSFHALCFAHFIYFAYSDSRGVADGQVGPVLTGPLFSQTEFFLLPKYISPMEFLY